MEKIVESCRFLLENYPGAQACKDYLNTRLKQESQEKFGFGYFPGAFDLSVITDMVGEEILLESNLLYHKQIEDHVYGPRNVPVSYFEHHPLIMPFRNTYGEVVALVGRSLLSEDERKIEKLAKYKNTKESKYFKKSNLLFGLYENRDSIMRENCVYVVEGQFDVIKAVERGFTNIVALGTNSMTAYQFSVISRYTDNIFLLLDNDEGGQKGRKKITSKFSKLANIQNFYLPEAYKDLDEYLTNSEDEALSFTVKV